MIAFLPLIMIEQFKYLRALLYYCMPETVVTRKYQVTIPKEVREALGIKMGDKLIVKVEDGKIIMEPVRAQDALKRLSTLADRYLGGPRAIDAVKLVEESIERETGIY